MCGIAGIMSFGGPVDRGELDRFTDSLAHRGPDGRGVFIDGRVGLGHRRLAILDLSESGQCPMSYGGMDGRRFWITFNGEVYNFIELRDELERMGHRFRTQTDTEVLVAAYAAWGPECLLRLNGMWAFAIWDAQERTLFLARDRFSVKPLYYFTDGRRLAFASEMKAFLSLSGFRPAIHEELVPRVLRAPASYEGMMDDTLLKGVRRLRGGHYMIVRESGDVATRKWWETAEHIPDVPNDHEERVERFRELFLDAVRIRMRSDTAIGTCLSGGIDSSSVACGMAHLHARAQGLERCPSDWQHMFVATFPGTALDERGYAEEVVARVDGRAHYWVFDPAAAAGAVADSVWATEEVYGGINVPIWSLYRELRRKGVVVSIDGHGSDELLGGYHWYLDWPMAEVNQNLYLDFHKGLLPAILRNYDRCSMAHGIEVRMPFMDWRVVTYAFGLPAEEKIGAGYTKRILREAMKGDVPARILGRQSKIGFNSPLIDWLNGDLATLVDRVTSHRLWLDSPYWDGKLLRARVWEKTRNRGWRLSDWDEAFQVWTLMNLVIWRLLFIEQDSGQIQ